MKLSDAVFYHIYPLGALGVLEGPREHPPGEAPLRRIQAWIPAMQRVGANALWLGPLFQSEHHGYDTVDFAAVDSRLGRNEDLTALSEQLREAGVTLVLDAVFNHVARSHPWVQDVAQRGAESPYAGWIAGFDPRGRRGGLPFGYDCWDGHNELVRIDTAHPEVREHLFGVVQRWIDEFDIGGLRLDAADCVDRAFMRQLGRRCRKRRPDFFLIGEAVQGDLYRPLLRRAGLDAVTNFEGYKALWSSHNDGNFHELAHTLRRLFGQEGLCRDRQLYSFADNHDVNRVASSLSDPACLPSLYALLFTMPGVPSIYYGSEFGLKGRRTRRSDRRLRPALDPAELPRSPPNPSLADTIGRLATARRGCPAVRRGSYRELSVQALGLSFLRWTDKHLAVVAANGGAEPLRFELSVAEASGRTLVDRLDPSCEVTVDSQGKVVCEVPGRWLRWLS